VVAHSYNFLNSHTTDFATAEGTAKGKARGKIDDNKGITRDVSDGECVRNKCNREGGIVVEVE
jgi:hypothetical protein